MIPPKAEALYSDACKYLYAKGWQREEYGSGWFWKQGQEECHFGQALDRQLEEDGIDMREEPAGVISPGYWG